MTNFDIAKRNYDNGLWSKEMLKMLVIKNKITALQFEAITSETLAE